MGRKRWMIAFAAVGFVATLLVVVSVWGLLVAAGVRVASLADLLWWRRRFTVEEDGRLPIYASVVGVLGIVWFWAVTERYAIPGSSMMPAIEIGDTVYIERLTTMWSSPKRGEVIVFTHPCEQREHIKRVIGLPGDTIEVRCSKLYVNGKAVPTELVERNCTYVDEVKRECSRYRETLGGYTFHTLQARGDGVSTKDFPSLDRIARTCRGVKAIGQVVATKDGAPACEQQLHYVVPPQSLFVMGDNRASSSDSRYWGVVPVENVRGRAIGIAWPLDHAGHVD
jgi:signal peptidase I